MAKDEKATDAAAADEPDLALVREQELAERPIAPPVGVVTDREKRAPLCELVSNLPTEWQVTRYLRDRLRIVGAKDL